LGEVVRLKTQAIRGDQEALDVRAELLGIANRLDAVAPLTPYVKWLGTLAGEVRKAARACEDD
jgi:hypothetical protein